MNVENIYKAELLFTELKHLQACEKIYEENNVGLEKYISSLLIELYGFDNVFKTDEIGYVSLLATLEGIKIEACKKYNKRTVKREVFKCMEIVKKLSRLLESD